MRGSASTPGDDVASSRSTPSDATTDGPQPSIEARRFAAMLADRTGDRAGAQALYDAALAASPDDLATILPAAMSALAHDAGDPRVDALVARHERLAPDDAWSAGLRAEMLLARGDAPAALVAAEEGLRRDRTRVEMRLILAKSLRANGRAEDAARLLSALAPEDRAKPPIALELARALSAVGAFGRAAEALERAIAANPTDPFVRADAAVAFARAGRIDRASVELEALEALPGGARERARVAPIVADLLKAGLHPTDVPEADR